MSPTKTSPTRAVVLLSGGIDSAVVLARAVESGWYCLPLTFDYGQRHAVEIKAARRIAGRHAHLPARVVRLDPLWGIETPLLTHGGPSIPKGRSAADRARRGVAPTYVPTRNLLLLAHAMAYAEGAQADVVLLGANAADQTGYPDCRPEFFDAFAEIARLGTRRGVEGNPIRVEAPLVHLSKADVIRAGRRLGVRFEETHSCYDPTGDRACGGCDACAVRREAFAEVGIPDPTRYVL